MIGVRANPGEEEVVREFFELFKTPWEFHQPGRRYEVVLSTGGYAAAGDGARLELVFAGEKTPGDEERGIRVDARRTGAALAYAGHRLPIYGPSVTFRGRGIGLAREGQHPQAAACVSRLGPRLVVRVGYDLFQEVRRLLMEGQPLANAAIPTLDLHIAVLRELIGWSGEALVEIPPVPAGYRFTACLTHDLDHPSIRRHRWDHTALGFLYRASIGSLINAWRGRAPARDVLANWAAALRLPFVYLGLAEDFWCDFLRYVAMDPGGASTFFAIPNSNDPGQTSDGPAPRRRAAPYGARDIADELRRLLAAGCEIGVHGIDAWMDSGRGRQELEEVSRISGAPEVGVRMHWLYWSEKSPVVLEQAGFSYDSTSGYNETVGYRAGTSQVFRPLGVNRLLELPLHVMDTALFYPGYLDLSPAEARQHVGGIIDHACREGGTVTVNWHDRSVAPERLWGRAYLALLQDLRHRGAWFPTAGEAVAWFRRRRAAVFHAREGNGAPMGARLPAEASDRLPGLRLRTHEPRAYREGSRIGADLSSGYVDRTVPLDAGTAHPARATR